MKTKDWPAIVNPRALIVGENSTLQWSDEVIEYVMFLDYFFRNQPYDHGERSRYTEAKAIFNCVTDLSDGRYQPSQVAGANLCNELLQRPPRGKRLLIPRNNAELGVRKIEKIITQNPTIETVFAVSLQTNYWLAEFGLYRLNEDFMHGAQPRNVGVDSPQPYYQPVDAKVFNGVCGNIFETEIKGRKINVVPILPAKEYPLYANNLDRFGKAYEAITKHFAELAKSEKAKS